MDPFVTTVDPVTFYFALLVNVMFVLAAVWGAISFYPRKSVRGNNAAAWLVLAIWLGFVGVGLNVFYWRVFGDLSLRHRWLAAHEIRWIGFYGDMLWKGLGVVSIYLHFYARYKSIPEEEQHLWTPLLMGYYPDLDAWARKVIMSINVRLGLKK